MSTRWCWTCWPLGSNPTWIYEQAATKAAGRRLDAKIDTAKPQDPALVLAVLGPLLGRA